MVGVAVFQFRENAIGLPLMVVAAVVAHQLVQRLFAHVPKGGMAEIVRQANGLDQVFVAAQRPRQRAADLRHLDAVGQAIAVMVSFRVDEDLGLVFQAPEGRRVDDAVTVALEVQPVGVWRFWIVAPAAGAVVHGVGRQVGVLAAFEQFVGEDRHRSPRSSWRGRHKPGFSQTTGFVASIGLLARADGRACTGRGAPRRPR